MPYEYRKLSPEDRRKVVEERKRRGFPLHQPPHPFRDAGWYLITAANYEHQPIMDSSERRTEFEGLLLAEFRKITDEIIAWAVLLNHYHILASLRSLDAASRAIKHLHGFTSHEWNLTDGLTGKRKVWYRFSDRLMRTEIQTNQAFNYLHQNPVKHGLVEDAFDWPWSSLSIYAEEHSRQWLQDCWDRFIPPEDFGSSWDE
jgi:putative transposase